jgi:hypothetical protein
MSSDGVGNAAIALSSLKLLQLGSGSKIYVTDRPN